MRKQKITLKHAAMLVIAACPMLVIGAYAQIFTGLPPAQSPLTGQEQVPADTGGSPPSVRIAISQLGQFLGGIGASGNFLIAGDATQNLWQRGIVGPTVTTTVAFGPDRWAYWSGASTPMTVSQDLSSIATLPGFAAAYKMQRASGASGVSPMCLAQEISSVNSRMMQGQIVELDFGVFGGANLSAAQVGIYIMAGTGVDEGMQKLAFGFNGGGGGSSGWTGQSGVVGALFSPLYIGRVTQPAVVGLVPTTATEVGVVLCMTPTGTAGASDSMSFSGIQLRVAPALASFVSKYGAYQANTLPTPPFVWRLDEAGLQQGYYWQLNEGAGIDVVANCRVRASGPTDCFVNFPVVMGKVPTMSYVTGFGTDSSPGGILVPCLGMATTTTFVPTVRGVSVGCASSLLPPPGTAGFLYDYGGSGKIIADAELN